METWTRKYQPKKIKEIVGQDLAIKELKRFIIDFDKDKLKKNKKIKNSALLYGPSGTGKTISAYALANDLGYEIFEINASDVRNKEQIEEKLGSVVRQRSLFSKGKIILVDEIDGLSGAKDRGGIQALLKLIYETTFPIILTATNPWNTKFSSLRSKSQLVEFKSLDYLSVFEILKEICKNEKIKAKDEILKTLARRAGGDARAAINDLQTLYEKNKNIELAELGERNKTENMINALLRVFKTTDPKLAARAFDNVQEDINQIFLWIDENLPLEYDRPQDLASAYDKLSRADVFRGRIKRWQHWRFLTYINDLISAGVALSKDEKYKKYVQYKPTSRLLKLWWAKQKSFKKKAIAHKLAVHTHTSAKQALKSIDYFRIIFKKNKKMANSITEQLNLDKEEIVWLKK